MKVPRFNPPFRGFHVLSKVVIVILTLNWAGAITLFPFVFYRNRWARLNMITRNHETIHIHQQMEWGMVGTIIYVTLSLIFHEWLWTLPALLLFYWLYLLNWAVQLFRYGKQAYANIAFEREAYTKANITNWHVLRRPFDTFKYL